MSSKRKQGAKRLAPGNAIESIKAINRMVQKHNMLYGNDDSTKLVLMSEADHIVEGAKINCYSEQYYSDLSCIALHRAYGFSSKRLRRYCEYMVAAEEEFKALRKADKLDDEDTWYYLEKFDRELLEACGEEYVPRAKRYHATFFYNGTKWDELSVEEADARMTQLRGDQVRGDSNAGE